jgi:KAP family P-loop domain/Trypsin-like peptidase domain
MSDRDRESGLVEARLVKVRAGGRGAGWAIGDRGVLTARHVVAPFLQGQADRCLVVPGPAPGAAVFDCAVAWEDESRDLALLAVKEGQVSDWVAAVGPGPGPVLAEPGTAGVSAEAVGYPDVGVENDFPHPELGLGWLRPAGGAVSGGMPFDVDGGVPEDALLWEGMSGAVVRDREFGRLLGVVVQVDEDRQHRRLYVAVFPDPLVTADFAEALRRVGARPVLEASYAPMSRRLLEWFDAAGRPPTAGASEDLHRVFGVHKARTDIDTHGDPYFPYADRDLDTAITLALDRRVSRDETRVLLLVGEAMTGKSRTGAHALQAHPVISGWPLLVPQHTADLNKVVELAPDTGAVLWLDDLNTYAAGLSPGVVRYWQSRPRLVVVATLRTDVLRILQANPDLRPAWSVVEDQNLVEQFMLPAEWSPSEQQGLAEADPSVRQELSEGFSLGGILGAEDAAAIHQFSDELAGGMSADLVKPDEGISADRDDLGMSTYVGMLATVIARHETPLPLSIGLFGEWGSGKSYFMGLLRERVKTLAASENPEYYHDIVQIGFNAWSYADSNLWASLGDEIFRQLAGPVGVDDGDKRPEALRQDLKETLERAKELAAAKQRAEGEAAQLHADLADARSAYSNSLTALVVATAQTGVAADLGRVWSRLGVDQQADQIQRLVDETRGAGKDASTLRQATANPWARGSIVVGVMAVIAMFLVPLLADQAQAVVSRAGATAFLLAATTLTVVLRNIRSATKTVNAVAASIRARIAENTDRRNPEQVARVRYAQAREQVLQAQLDDVLLRAGELGRELVEINPGQRLYGFVTERAGSGDYRGQLGLISTIRRDFQQLIKLMDQWRKHPDNEARRPIDRIVLYIDDLDRCSPSQVVDVLQAVHLLLALDLFVVVVGVDPRWLLQSLRQQYRRILAAESGTNDEEGKSAWSSSPTDYLEKIFNIPFVLPTMTPDTFKLLIARLSGADKQPTQTGDSALLAEDGNVPESASSGAQVPASQSTGLDESRGLPDADGLLHAEAESEVAAQQTAQSGGDEAADSAQVLPRRPLTKPELDLIFALSPMVRTPREAKRLLNLYRMLRSTQDLSDASLFIGTEEQPGQYQAVGVLLGLLTAYPLLLGEILSADPDPKQKVEGGLCLRRASNTSWTEFVASLEPNEVGDGWCNSVRGGLDQADCERWTHLARAALPSAGLVTLPDLSAFRSWGPHVARFSFVLSALNVTDPSTD